MQLDANFKVRDFCHSENFSLLVHRPQNITRDVPFSYCTLNSGGRRRGKTKKIAGPGRLELPIPAAGCLILFASFAEKDGIRHGIPFPVSAHETRIRARHECLVQDERSESRAAKSGRKASETIQSLRPGPRAGQRSAACIAPPEEWI